MVLTTALLAWSGMRGWLLVSFIWFAGLGVVLAFVDAAVLRLPHLLVAALTAGFVAPLGIHAAAGHTLGRLGVAVLVAAALWLLVTVVNLLPGSGLGDGDRSLLVPVGLATGYISWLATVAALVLAFLLVAVLGMVLVAVGRATWRSPNLPLGPGLVVATLVMASLAAYVHAL